jgi:hypothetical protein
MRVLSAHRGNDTGGTGWRIANAFRNDPDVSFRSACNSSSILPYLDYPEDVPWDLQRIQELYAEADLFHARNDWSTYSRLGGRKPAVIHYHGTNFRTLNAQRLREQKEHAAIGLVSTLDLWLIKPEMLEWLPSPYDLEMLSEYQQAASHDL